MNNPLNRPHMTEEDKKEQREAMKQALQEWLDARFAEFGRWTLTGLVAAIFIGIVSYLIAHGWRPT